MAETTINTEIFERLQEQLRRSRQQFDEWANKQTTAIQRSTEEHTKTVVKEKENIERCQSHAAQLHFQTAHNKRVQEERDSTLSGLTEEVNELRVRSSHLESQAQDLQQRIAAAEKAVGDQRQANAQYIARSQANYAPTLNAYATWLGLRFERISTDDGRGPGVNFIFTKIDPEDPDRVFRASVFVGPTNEYIAGHSEPAIPMLDAFCLEATRTGNFSSLAQSIRREFVKMALNGLPAQ